MGLMQKADRNHLDKNGGLPPEAISGIEDLFKEFYGSDEDEDEENEDDKDSEQMLESGLQQAKADESRPLTDVITDLKKNIQEWSR